VLWPEVSSRGEPDFGKARAARVAGILTGAVARAPSGATLTLWLFTSSTKPASTWSFPLTTTGLLQAAAVRRVEQDLGTALEPRAAPPAGAAVAAVAAAPVLQPQQPPPPAQEPRQPAPEPTPPPPGPPAGAERPAAAAAEAKADGRWILAGELGLFVTQRKLTYSGVTPSTGTLLGFDASSIMGPAVRVELFPAARGGSNLLGGLGLIGAYETSIGLKTLAPTGEERSTTCTRLQLGAAWRSPALGERVVLIPSLSYRALRVTVSPPIDGLPNTDLSGVKIALDAELALGGRVVLLAGAGWVKWLTARELIDGSPPYFPSQGAWALEAELGVGVRIWGPISLRLVGDYSSTTYTLRADPGGAYQATGAEDRLLGARAVVRGTW
jgi:hypothetical protein